MATWQVRQEGSLNIVGAASPTEVLAGLMDGIWLPSDEVRGPGETAWKSIETHPTFAEAAEELEQEPIKEEDDTHLDMNPLIDVCLVLLIFFILTITYESLERAIEIPTDSTQEKKGNPIPKVKFEDIKDRVFRVIARMDGDKVVIKLEGEIVTPDNIFSKMKELVTRTGRKEMFLDIDGNVQWGVETAILDAAKGNGVHNILIQSKSKK